MIDVSKTKLVIAAAGAGKRMLPATWFLHKELLPIPRDGYPVPVILAQVLDALDAGILKENIRIVVSEEKYPVFFEAFSKDPSDLVEELKADGKEGIAAQLEKIPRLTPENFIIQGGPYGNATPLMNAAIQKFKGSASVLGDRMIKNEEMGSPLTAQEVYDGFKSNLTKKFIHPEDWVIYSYADDLFLGDESDFSQMIEAAKACNCSIFAAMHIKNREDYDRFGVVDGKALPNTGGKAIEIEKIVEKPGFENAPSNLASVSAYLFAPRMDGDEDYLDIVGAIQNEYKNYVANGEVGEFMIQPAIQEMIARNADKYPQGKIVAVELEGEYREVGSMSGYGLAWSSKTS